MLKQYEIMEKKIAKLRDRYDSALSENNIDEATILKIKNDYLALLKELGINLEDLAGTRVISEKELTQQELNSQANLSVLAAKVKKIIAQPKQKKSKIQLAYMLFDYGLFVFDLLKSTSLATAIIPLTKQQLLIAAHQSFHVSSLLYKECRLTINPLLALYNAGKTLELHADIYFVQAASEHSNEPLEPLNKAIDYYSLTCTFYQDVKLEFKSIFNDSRRNQKQKQKDLETINEYCKGLTLEKPCAEEIENKLDSILYKNYNNLVYSYLQRYQSTSNKNDFIIAIIYHEESRKIAIKILENDTPENSASQIFKKNSMLIKEKLTTEFESLFKRTPPLRNHDENEKGKEKEKAETPLAEMSASYTDSFLQLTLKIADGLDKNVKNEFEFSSEKFNEHDLQASIKKSLLVLQFLTHLKVLRQESQQDVNLELEMLPLIQKTLAQPTEENYFALIQKLEEHEESDEAMVNTLLLRKLFSSFEEQVDNYDTEVLSSLARAVKNKKCDYANSKKEKLKYAEKIEQHLQKLKKEELEKSNSPKQKPSTHSRNNHKKNNEPKISKKRKTPDYDSRDETPNNKREFCPKKRWKQQYLSNNNKNKSQGQINSPPVPQPPTNTFLLVSSSTTLFVSSAQNSNSSQKQSQQPSPRQSANNNSNHAPTTQLSYQTKNFPSK